MEGKHKSKKSGYSIRQWLKALQRH